MGKDWNVKWVRTLIEDEEEKERKIAQDIFIDGLFLYKKSRSDHLQNLQATPMEEKKV